MHVSPFLTLQGISPSSKTTNCLLTTSANLIRQTCIGQTGIGKLELGELVLANLNWAKDPRPIKASKNETPISVHSERESGITQPKHVWKVPKENTKPKSTIKRFT